VRHLFLLIVALGTAAGPLGAARRDPLFEARAAEAVARAVERRMGRGTVVEVESITVTATPADGALEATPAPDARSGRPSLFSLTVTTAAGPRRVGSAMATVRVEADQVHATVPLMRGAVVATSEVTAVRATADLVSFRPLPVESEIVGARVTRALEAGAVFTGEVLAVLPAVKAGQQVRVRAAVDGIVAYGVAVAAEQGRVGEVIKVVNPDSKRTLSGRVTAPGEVEVLHGS
jgi:flagellar basal body P-ring formation protein FlgA